MDLPVILMQMQPMMMEAVIIHPAVMMSVILI